MVLMEKVRAARKDKHDDVSQGGASFGCMMAACIIQGYDSGEEQGGGIHGQLEKMTQI